MKKRILSLFLAFMMFLTPLAQLKVNAKQPQTGMEAVLEKESISGQEEDISVSMQVDSQWGSGYNATVTISNSGDTVFDNWHLRLESDNTIQNIWNASILEQEDGTYIIKNAGWNQDIPGGGSVSFGFTAGCEDAPAQPELVLLPMKKQLVPEVDYQCEYASDNNQSAAFYNATLTIRNVSENVIEDWMAEFDFEGSVDSIWNGEILSREENHYIIKNASYNQNIMGNSCIVFGFQGSKAEGTMPQPQNVKLYSMGFGTEEMEETGDTEAGEDNPAEDDMSDTTVSGGDASTGGDDVTDDTVPDDNAPEDKENSDETVPEEDTPGNDDSADTEEFLEETDTDGDGITDIVEESLGFDIHLADTDEDGLPDGYELYTLYPLLLKKGYDEIAGVNPGDDYDEDGLTNLEEYHVGTNPGNEDTDGDTLTDYEEIYTYGTEPALLDTDGDGLNDGLEVEQGMEPLETDSDKDGIPDGEEIISQHLETEGVTLEETGVLPILDITGSGDFRQKMDIVDVSHNKKYENTGFIVGHPFDFRHGEELVFEEAVLTFHVSEEILAVNAIENLAVAWYDEENNRVELLETTCNEADGTVSAKPKHFSVYAVVDTELFENNVEAAKSFIASQGEAFGGHRYLLIDESMPWNDARTYCEELGGHLVIIESREEQEFLTGLLKRKGTKNTYFIGLSKVNNQFCWVDGTPLDYENWAPGEPNASDENVVHMYAQMEDRVGMWNNTYNKVTRTRPFFWATKYCGMICEFPEVADDPCTIMLSDGSVVELDKDPGLGDGTIDTDGDGLPDIVELGMETELSRWYCDEMVKAWTYRSNPAVTDTDGDGFTDGNDPAPTRYDITVQETYGNNVIKLNTGVVYCIFGMDINAFYEQYYTRHLNPASKETLETLKRQLELNDAYCYSVDEAAFFCNIDKDGMCDYMMYYPSFYKKKVYEKLFGVFCTEALAEYYFNVTSIGEAWKNYFKDSLDQIIYGKYTESGNLVGTVGELGLAFTGLDGAQDFRDLIYDTTHWEDNWEDNLKNAGEIIVGGVCLIPIIGVIGKADEIVALVKREEKLFEIRVIKCYDKVVTTLGELKYVTKVQELVGTASQVMQEVGTEVYRIIMNALEGTKDYRLQFVTPEGIGIYDNVAIQAMCAHSDDIIYLSRIDEDIVQDIAEEVVNSGSKNMDELEEIVEEAVDDAKKTLGDVGGNNLTIVQECISKIPDTLKQVGKCDEFAQALVKKLDNEKVSYEIMGVWSDTSIIYSDTLGDFISTNYYHYGIRVDDKVYDNVNFTGISFDDWKLDMGGDGYIIIKQVEEINPTEFIAEMRNRIE